MEYLDIVDENGQPTGESVSRELAHQQGIPHRTTHVWVVRKGEAGFQVLLQKRSMGKESFPGMYDTSSAGHVPAGSEPLPSALRELSEELGIDAAAGELRFAGTFHTKYEKIFHGHPYKDDEFASLFVYTRPVDIGALTLQASEVDEVRWFDLEAVWEEIHRSRERFCVPTAGLALLRRYLHADGPPQPPPSRLRAGLRD